jgi:hypothetical protein
MVSKKKSVKRQFAKSGKRLTKKYTKCVEYIKKQGEEVEEPEITEVLLTPEEVVEPEPEPEDVVVEPEVEVVEPEVVVEPEPEDEVVEAEVVPEPEDEVVEAENDFKFVEPSNFKVQGQLLNGDRVLEVDPLNVVDVPETTETVETLEMINDKKVKAEKTTPKKKESATPKKRRGKKTSKRSRSSSEKPKMKSLNQRN